MENISFGIVGCGRIGARHAEIASQAGSLISLCDIDIEKANTVALKYSLPVYNDIDKMLEGSRPDVLVVCTPNYLHAQHTIKGLKAGCHVICEKPMALTAADCRQMIDAAEKANKKLFIVKQNRYNPPVAAVKKLLEENRLGTVYMAELSCYWNRDDEYFKNSWKAERLRNGGTLFTQFSHFIDLLYWYFGDVKNFTAVMANYHHKNIIDFEDSGMAMLEFANGMMASVNFTVNSYNKNMEGSLTIIAENGTIKIGGQYLNELEYQQLKDYRIENLPKGNPANEYGRYTGSMSNHNMVYQNVIDVLKNGQTVATSGFEGMKTVELIEKIYASARFLSP